jgi:hypothetical protein
MPRVHVVDDHDEALEAIHKAIRERAAPLRNLALVHFDAHPDLSVPRRLPASAVYCPGLLYEVSCSRRALCGQCLRLRRFGPTSRQIP